MKIQDPEIVDFSQNLIWNAKTLQLLPNTSIILFFASCLWNMVCKTFISYYADVPMLLVATTTKYIPTQTIASCSWFVISKNLRIVFLSSRRHMRRTQLNCWPKSHTELFPAINEYNGHCWAVRQKQNQIHHIKTDAWTYKIRIYSLCVTLNTPADKLSRFKFPSKHTESTGRK